MSPELTKLMSQIRKLTPEERRQIVQMIQLRDGDGVAHLNTVRFNDDWLLPGIESELKRQGLLAGFVSKKLLAQWGPNYTKESATIREFLRKHMRDHPNHVELLALGRICAKELIRYVRDVKQMPLGPQNVLRAVPDMAAALEHSFPGYLQAGILQKLIRV